MPFATRRYIRRKRKQAKRPKKKTGSSQRKRQQPRKKSILQILTDLYHSKAPKKGVVPYRFKPLKLDRAPRVPAAPWQDGYRPF
jgi:hypothetical protein